MLFHRLGQVGQHDRQRVDDIVTIDLRHLLVFRQNPPGGNTVGGLNGLDAVDFPQGVRGLQGQVIIHQDLTLSHHLSLDADGVLVGAKGGAVMQPDGGDDEAHVLGVLPPEDDDAADELTAVALIHQGDEAVAKLHLHRLHRQQGIDVVNILVIVALAGRGQFGDFCGGLGGGGCRLLLGCHPAGEEHAAPHQRHAAPHQGDGGRAGDDGHEQQDDARGGERPGLGGELAHHVGVQASVGHGAGDDHARGGGDHQGRDLGHKAIADGEDTDGAEGLHGLHPPAYHADEQSAHQVDEGDDDRHGGVALDDLGGAVHGAVEVRFLLDLLPAYPGLLLVNKA